MVPPLTFPHLAPLIFISAALLRWQKKYQNKSFSLYSFLWFNHLYGLAAAVGNRHTTRQGLSSVSSQSFLFSEPKSIMDAESSHCSPGKLSLTSQYSTCYISSCLICQLLINLQLIIARFHLQYIKFLNFQNCLDVCLPGDGNCPQQHPKQAASLMAEVRQRMMGAHTPGWSCLVFLTR